MFFLYFTLGFYLFTIIRSLRAYIHNKQIIVTKYVETDHFHLKNLIKKIINQNFLTSLIFNQSRTYLSKISATKLIKIIISRQRKPQEGRIL